MLEREREYIPQRRFMLEALSLAQQALKEGEVPVGAVIIKDNEIIARGYNTREKLHRATGHAEISAIEQACEALKSWRLDGCIMYVTLEPCPMCAGALINARVPLVVYAAQDDRAGCCGGIVNLFSLPFNHKPYAIRGFMEQESQALLKNFFKSLRS